MKLWVSQFITVRSPVDEQCWLVFIGFKRKQIEVKKV